MQQLRLRFILSVLLLFPLCASCAGFSLSAPQVTGLATCQALNADNSTQDITDTFYLDSPQICCSARLTSIRERTAILVRWEYISGDRAATDKPLLDEQTAECSADCILGFTLKPPVSGFISGEYRVVWLLAGQEKARAPFNIQRDTSAGLPQIASFKAAPLSINAGQAAMLTWQVSGATRIAIEPAIGMVNASGNRSVNPALDTTYTLYALNRGGVSSNSLSLKVNKAVTARPDLVITEFWSSGNVLAYRVRNNGKVSSCPTQSYLYKNGQKESEDYVEPLAAGEERVEQFGRYHFSPRFASVFSGTSVDGMGDAVNIRICVNADSSCNESDTQNNCLEHNFGPLWKLDMLRYVNTAAWQSSAGDLRWPMFKGNTAGYAGLTTAPMEAGASSSSAILLTPPQVKSAWIQGRIGLPQDYPPRLTPFTLPPKCKFSVRVGLTPETPAGVSVKFTLGTARGAEISYFPPVILTSGGKFEPYEADLSRLAGQEVEFILRAEASAPLQQGCAAWIEPVITQER